MLFVAQKGKRGEREGVTERFRVKPKSWEGVFVD